MPVGPKMVLFLKRKTETIDTVQGGYSESWAVLRSITGVLSFPGGISALPVFQKVPEGTTHKFITDYPVADQVVQGDRLQNSTGKRVFEVIATEDPQGTTRFQTIYLKEMAEYPGPTRVN